MFVLSATFDLILSRIIPIAHPLLGRGCEPEVFVCRFETLLHSPSTYLG